MGIGVSLDSEFREEDITIAGDKLTTTFMIQLNVSLNDTNILSMIQDNHLGILGK